MEQGTYKVSEDPHEIYERLAPLAKSKLVIDKFRPDLEPELWTATRSSIELSEAGKRMDDLDLLPAPFPVHEFLPGARPAPRDAPIPGWRSLLREPLRAEGREPDSG